MFSLLVLSPAALSPVSTWAQVLIEAFKVVLRSRGKVLQSAGKEGRK